MYRLPAIVLALTGCLVGTACSTRAPRADLVNSELALRVHLPDARKGFYRATRFDWSGIVTSLRYRGQELVTPWYQGVDPNIGDFEFRGDAIVSGPNSAMVGMPEEFNTAPSKIPLGWDEAGPGGTFLKIGVGILRRPDDAKYSHYNAYEIVDGGTRRITRTSSSMEFEQVIDHQASGFGYVYQKRLVLAPGKPRLSVIHSLRNTGRILLRGQVYDHNFTRWNGEPPGPDYTVKFGFSPTLTDSVQEPPVSLEGRNLAFSRELRGEEMLRITPTGFDNSAADYDFRIENRKLGIGLHITADRPLAQVAIWAVRSVFAVEPFIPFEVAPGSEFNWTLHYDFYPLSH